VITSVAIRSGDILDAGQVLMQLASEGAPVVLAEVTDAQAAQLSPDQEITVKLDGTEAAPMPARLFSLSGASRAGRLAQFRVEWSTTPAFGRSTDILVNLKQKSDVLIVPKKAIHSAGARKYVEYVTGSSRRRVNVELGIVSTDDAEIVSGLTEGQLVLLG
jgi:hypothetical protein